MFITWAWSAAFVLMAVANVLMIYVPGLPLWSGLAIAFAARNTAVYFTKWYPQYPAGKVCRTGRHRPERYKERHCERSEAIQRHQERLDCFVALLLAMTRNIPVEERR